MTGIDRTAPYRYKGVTRNTLKWFDSEALEKLNATDKFFKKLKKSRLNIDSYTKKVKYDASNLLHQKKPAFFEERRLETIGNPKELCESLKSLGMSDKIVIANFNAIEGSNTCSIYKFFKKFFASLAESLLIKLSKPRD